MHRLANSYAPRRHSVGRSVSALHTVHETHRWFLSLYVQIARGRRLLMIMPAIKLHKTMKKRKQNPANIVTFSCWISVSRLN